jgi:hypothetical protein
VDSTSAGHYCCHGLTRLEAVSSRANWEMWQKLSGAESGYIHRLVSIKILWDVYEVWSTYGLHFFSSRKPQRVFRIDRPQINFRERRLDLDLEIQEIRFWVI